MLMALRHVLTQAGSKMMPGPMMRLTVIATLGLGLAGCESLSPSRSAGVAEVVQDTGGNQTANIASLSEVISRNPNDAVAYNTRGAAYARIGRYSDAIADFNKATQIDPNQAAAYTNRALAFRQTGKNDAAMTDFTRATQADPSYAPAYVGRANLLRVQGKHRAGAGGSEHGYPAEPGGGRGLSFPRACLSARRAAPAGHLGF